MLSWIFIFVPIVAAALLLIFFTKKVVWWEVAALIVPSAIIILLMNTIMVAYRTSDTEYLGSYINKVIYYEAWNERVSCRHPIYCTRTYKCGKSICTQTYVCGHHHAYDVDFHPENWQKKDNLGHEYSISKSEYNKLKDRFATKTYFVELNRDFHTIDGDAYHTDWAGQPDKSEVITSEGSYTNKVRASHSIFKFEDINEKQKKQWSLYDYPNVSGYYQPIVLGKKVDEITERKLQYLNGYYGAKKQFKMFILFFKNQPIEAALKQRSYWEGGNKNEFIVCIGTDKSGKTNWVKCFSWMDKPELEVYVQDYLKSNKDIDLSKFADWMPNQIQQRWHRKDFKDFDYLQIELTDTQLWWILVIIMIYNIGLSIWVVVNEYHHNNYNLFKDYDEKERSYRDSQFYGVKKKSVFEKRLEDIERKKRNKY